MSAMVGADPAELDQFALALADASGRLATIEAFANLRLFMAQWIGADIDQARDEWSRVCRPALDRARTGLDDAAGHVREQAQQQREASAVGNQYSRKIEACQAGPGDAGEQKKSWFEKAGGFVGGVWDGFVDGGKHVLDFGRDVGATAIGGAAAVDVWAFNTAYDLVSAIDPGFAGERLAVAEPGRPVLDTRGPIDVNAMFRNMDAVYEPGSCHIEIQRVRSSDGTISYVVYIPGTEEWLPGGNQPNNFVGSDAQAGLFNSRSAMTYAVLDAMQKSGIPPGSPVILAGHSLGGMEAVRMANDSDIRDAYSIRGVVTAGAGSGWQPIPDDIEYLALQRNTDIVPAIGGGGIVNWLSPSPHHQVISVDDGYLGDVGGAHKMSNYVNAGDALKDAGALDVANQHFNDIFGPDAEVTDSYGYDGLKYSGALDPLEVGKGIRDALRS